MLAILSRPQCFKVLEDIVFCDVTSVLVAGEISQRPVSPGPSCNLVLLRSMTMTDWQ